MSQGKSPLRAGLFLLFVALFWSLGPAAALAAIYMAPGGQSIGVLLQTEGVTVTGISPVIDDQGQSCQPATQAGLESGDFITAINGRAIRSNDDMLQAIDQAARAGQSCRIEYIRSGSVISAEVEPIYCADTDSWRIGLYVRDNTAGVGTLTCYDPVSGFYAALGHQVSGLDGPSGGETIGSIVRANVQGLIASGSGAPGEKLGSFMNDGWRGTIMANSDFGIYGYLNSAPAQAFPTGSLPVAEPEQVHTGPALIYTVLEGESIQAYTVDIVKTAENQKAHGWGLIVEITDQRLLDSCGGIIQGMSGSPIIQDGRLAGAVTHVFVNDPTHGYGCYAMWMLEEAGYGQG